MVWHPSSWALADPSPDCTAWFDNLKNLYILFRTADPKIQDTLFDEAFHAPLENIVGYEKIDTFLRELDQALWLKASTLTIKNGALNQVKRLGEQTKTSSTQDAGDMLQTALFFGPPFHMKLIPRQAHNFRFLGCPHVNSIAHGNHALCDLIITWCTGLLQASLPVKDLLCTPSPYGCDIEIRYVSNPSI